LRRAPRELEPFLRNRVRTFRSDAPVPRRVFFRGRDARCGGAAPDAKIVVRRRHPFVSNVRRNLSRGGTLSIARVDAFERTIVLPSFAVGTFHPRENLSWLWDTHTRRETRDMHGPERASRFPKSPIRVRVGQSGRYARCAVRALPPSSSSGDVSRRSSSRIAASHVGYSANVFAAAFRDRRSRAYAERRR